MSSILIAEDHAEISSFIDKGLRANGHRTTITADGRQAWALAGTGAFDLLILDVGLPGLDGFEVLRRLRGDGVDVPVSILTARDGVDDTVAHADRYVRAEEFVDVVTALWESWEPDALRLDADAATFAEPGKVHTLDHRGAHFAVRGPLNSPRSPQGRPVLVQAGSSEAGKELAARIAEVVFTAQRSVADGVAFYDDL